MKGCAGDLDPWQTVSIQNMGHFVVRGVQSQLRTRHLRFLPQPRLHLTARVTNHAQSQIETPWLRHPSTLFETVTPRLGNASSRLRITSPCSLPSRRSLRLRLRRPMSSTFSTLPLILLLWLICGSQLRLCRKNQISQADCCSYWPRKMQTNP